MNYYILACPEPMGQRAARFSYYPDDLDLDWSRGAAMPPGLKLPVEAVLELGDEGYIRDLVEVPLPMVSKRLAEALQQAGVSNVEFFPCRVTVKATGQVIEDSLAFNIVGAVSCVDKSRSRFKDPGGLGKISMMFEKLVLKDPGAQGLHIFRLAEFIGVIVVSEVLRRHLEAAVFPDLMFLEPEEWGN
jgi:hypothetical protein